MFYDLKEGADICKPYIAFYGGWWDMAGLAVFNFAKLYTSGEMPDSVIDDALTVVVMVFVFRSMYALVQYFPYGRKGRTVWYPLAEVIAIIIVMNTIGNVLTFLDLDFFHEIWRGILFVAVVRAVMSFFIFGQNFINLAASFFASKFRRQ